MNILRYLHEYKNMILLHIIWMWCVINKRYRINNSRREDVTMGLDQILGLEILKKDDIEEKSQTK